MPLQHKAYTICSRTPLFDTDEPIDQEGDVKFYPMFQVRDIDNSHRHFRSLIVWNGTQYETLLRIVPAATLTAAAREHDVTPKKSDTLVVDPDDMEKVYAILAKKPTGVTGRIAGWDLTVAPGADVGAFCMLGAILDDMVGWFA